MTSTLGKEVVYSDTPTRIDFVKPPLRFDPYTTVRNFEAELCRYTGAKYAVAVGSCTMALLLACKYLKVDNVTIPKRSYLSVPMSIIHAGGQVSFEDVEWSGQYQLKPYPIIDSARRFTSNMYHEGTFTCVSFHWSKVLSIGQGGAILHDNKEADDWFRRMRFDGRKEGVAPNHDEITMLGYHCYMSPRDAAEGISRLSLIKENNPDLPNDPYPDLSTISIFNSKKFCPNCETEYHTATCKKCIL